MQVKKVYIKNQVQLMTFYLKKKSINEKQIENFSVTLMSPDLFSDLPEFSIKLKMSGVTL